MRRRSAELAAALALAMHAGAVRGAEPLKLDAVDVVGHYDNRLGTTDAASAGVITPQLIEDRPLLRPGQLLEYVPGLVVTQHSGAGKANQYFLRGFDLDHGTDFATRVAGMPVNLRTHGHGQGYTDLNFIIPELVSRVDYYKGPYYANVGDFSSAGGANMYYFDNLKQGIALGTLGNFHYARGLLAGSAPAGPGTLTYGLEAFHNDGPWEVPDNYRKYNGVLRYVVPVGPDSLGITGMAYSGKWNATDQVAQRAVDEGLIGRFGTLDDSTGGTWTRYSVSADYATPLAGGRFETTAYWIKYDLNLFSNFTYFLTDPENGDQFEQADDRNIYGWQGEWSKVGELFGRPTRNTLGFELRQDRIDPVLPVCNAAARAAVDHARGRCHRGQRWSLRTERYAVERLVPLGARPALRPLSLQGRQRDSRELGQSDRGHLVAEGGARARSVGRRPNTSSTPATASTATTRAG